MPVVMAVVAVVVAVIEQPLELSPLHSYVCFIVNHHSWIFLQLSSLHTMNTYFINYDFRLFFKTAVSISITSTFTV